MSRTIHWNSIRPESCYTMILRCLVKHITPRCMIYDHTGIFYAKVVCPGCRQIHPVNYIFSFLIVKMSVLLDGKLSFQCLTKALYCSSTTDA